jgi:enoyl-CoA hydratase/carnithine racemase
VTRGAGRAFCAGLDLKEHAMARTGRLESVPEALREQRKVSEIVMLIRRAPRFRDV